ncbi:MAG: hypothetical protein ABI777_08105 [Betaproteobacteria bacterium]
MNGLTLLLVLALAIGVFVAYRAGFMRGRREAQSLAPLRPAASAAAPVSTVEATVSAPVATAVNTFQIAMPDAVVDDGAAAERARLLRSLEGENAALRRTARGTQAITLQLQSFADDRRRLLAELATARAETARYRTIVVDLENNAPPLLLDNAGMPDDLKLIVGIGPVLERMLHQLGISTYRQIAHWSERDIDEIDGKLPEFPGRIRRDTWVVQARALHQSKFGETLPLRERR